MKRPRLTHGLHHHLLLLLLQLHLHRHLLSAQPYDYPSANLSTTWTNSHDGPHNISYFDGTAIKAILLRQGPAFYGPSFACGFYCRDPCTQYLFAAFIVYINSGADITLPTTGIPQVVWSANRDSPVGENASLQLTSDGDLVLKNAEGKVAWSTNTTGKDVVGMNLTERGNLVLFNANNGVVWQSFDHPTDTLLSGQSLVEGQRLTANATTSYWTRGPLYISYTPKGFRAFVDSNPPQVYFSFSQNITDYDLITNMNPCFLSVTSKALTFLANSSGPTTSPPIFPFQFLRLESDGHMKLYEWQDKFNGWRPTADVIKPEMGDCAFPTVCGSYGICETGQCGCPAANASTTFFKRVNDARPNLGCSPVTPLSCESPQKHQLLPLGDVAYFSYLLDDVFLHPNITTEESCRVTCLGNCSYKAALFLYGSNASDGSCYLPQEIFSLMKNVREVSHYNSSAYIKVQTAPTSPFVPSPSNPTENPPISKGKNSSTARLAGFVTGAIIGTLLIVAIAIVLFRKASKREKENDEEEDFPQLPGMPTRFSYEDMKSATTNFNKKLGGGGFGSVFDGTLADTTRVAVKRLESVNQGKREFLAEVETIGSIHHLNLVRLIGFCVEKSHRLLVYEHMSNGSLDKWIFKNDENHELGWDVLRRIIHQVAKGLSYLHEECRQKIAHLDIKPENILLDSNFDAKVSDFGLAKLIDRDQSAVMTMMRGTPGYLAPEWLTSIITEKVDVYSFGIVIMEIVCGRKNVDFSQPEESIHLLPLVKEKAMAGQLLDVIDKNKRDVQRDGKELEEMLKLAIWCVQYDPSKRPAMSIVVKVFEGVVDITPELDFNFTIPAQKFAHKLDDSSGSTPLLPSGLSGPR